MVPVEEYLGSGAEPNAEYIDGVVRPKPLPTYKHGRMEFRVSKLIDDIATFDAVPEQTVKLREGKYLVPDVAVKRTGDLQQPYPEKPVYLCVEVLSPEDRFSDALAKCEDYHEWGVKFCWLIDPEKKLCWEYPAFDRPQQVPADGHIAAGAISLSLKDLFDDF